MSGKRLTPNPTGVQPLTELVEPALAQPLRAPMAQPFDPGPTAGPPTGPGMGPNVGTPVMVHPGMVQAEQLAQQAAANIPAFQPATEPFAKFHNDDGSPMDQQPQSAIPEEEEITELTAAERLELSSIFTIGRKTEVIDIYGHPVCIESLAVGDDLLVGIYRREYMDAPPADSRAYQIAVCAAGIRTMNGVPLYQPLSDEEGDHEVFMAKAAKVAKLYPPVVTDIYQAILALDEQHAALREKLKKLKG